MLEIDPVFSGKGRRVTGDCMYVQVLGQNKVPWEQRGTHLRACPDREAIKSYQRRLPRGSACCEEACGLSRSKSGGQRGTDSKDRFPLGKWEAAPTKGMPDNVVSSMKDLMLSLEALK